MSYDPFAAIDLLDSTSNRPRTKDEAWKQVREALRVATSMHFDFCHKIYISLDQTQTDLFSEHGYETFTPDADLLNKWFKEDSCSLRFVEAVRTSPTGEAEFLQLILQFFEED